MHDFALFRKADGLVSVAELCQMLEKPIPPHSITWDPSTVFLPHIRRIQCSKASGICVSLLDSFQEKFSRV